MYDCKRAYLRHTCVCWCNYVVRVDVMEDRHLHEMMRLDYVAPVLMFELFRSHDVASVHTALPVEMCIRSCKKWWIFVMFELAK